MEQALPVWVEYVEALGAAGIMFVTVENEQGKRVTNEEEWENAIQQVLAACKDFDVPCGFPATTNDIEMRMEQGFSVFVISWGENGFATVDMGKSAAHD